MQKIAKVVVLLSTYNGEKYLKEQLDSIFNQKDVDVFVLASDDCSKDNTVAILEEYSKSHNLSYRINSKNKNFTYNFLDLIYDNLNADYDYFALADQDDFWLPEKLVCAIKLLKEKNKHLYCSNLTVVDSLLNNPKPMNKFADKKATVAHLLLENICTGCTSLFDKEFAMHLAKHYPENIYLHDYWLMLVAAFSSSYVYDSNSYILYRQHGTNQIGSNEQSLKAYADKLKKSKSFRIHLCEELLIGFGDDIDGKKKQYLNTFINYKTSFKSRMKIFFSSSYNAYSHPFLRKIKVLLKKY